VPKFTAASRGHPCDSTALVLRRYSLFLSEILECFVYVCLWFALIHNFVELQSFFVDVTSY